MVEKRERRRRDGTRLRGVARRAGATRPAPSAARRSTAPPTRGVRGEDPHAQAHAARSPTSTPAARRSPSSSRSGGRSTPARTSSARRCAPTRSFWNSHALPRLGHLQLRELTPQTIARFRAELEAAGVGNEAIRKTMTMLQGVLQRAVEWGRVPTNAVKLTRKPPKQYRPAVQAIPPSVIEVMRARLLERRPAARRDAAGRCSPTPGCGRRRRSRWSGATCASARCWSSARSATGS